MRADAIKDVARVPTYKEVNPTQLQALLLVCPTSEDEQLLNQNKEMRNERLDGCVYDGAGRFTETSRQDSMCVIGQSI